MGEGAPKGPEMSNKFEPVPTGAEERELEVTLNEQKKIDAQRNAIDRGEKMRDEALAKVKAELGDTGSDILGRRLTEVLTPDLKQAKSEGRWLDYLGLASALDRMDDIMEIVYREDASSQAQIRKILTGDQDKKLRDVLQHRSEHPTNVW